MRVLLKTGDRATVPSSLDALLEKGEAQGRVRACIEVRMLMALFQHAENALPAAAEWLFQPLALAAPEGFLRIFLDERPALLDLLPKARQAAPELVDAILGIQQVESAPAASPFDRLPEPLSEQELRVLGLIVAGKTNSEIANELVSSVGTAKWHVHNILQKLGVRNRSQAIAGARELGF